MENYIVILFLVVYILFLYSMFTALKRVPEEKLIMPAWCSFLCVVPVLGFIFVWIMMPFAIPRSFRKVVADNAEAVKKTKIIAVIGFILALSTVIGIKRLLELLAISPLLIHYILPSALLVMIITMISYWILVVNFRKQYLDP